ncbi:MAG: N-acetylglucosamine-6-phosphate deacetylase [Spirochaetales bacterium]|nr:N-acetylglucosamine-6-phosphate deacetylase [Spirochaetales bacterium]
MGFKCLKNARIFTGYTYIDNGAVIIKDNQIYDVVGESRLHKLKLDADTEMIDLGGRILTAGFVDTHIHGIHGFGTEDGTVESILGMSEALIEYGVTSFCPTIYPQPDSEFLSSLHACRDAIGKEKGAKIRGLHLEGPFISKEKRGAQKEDCIKEVNLDLMKHFVEETGGNIAIMTVAPELKNMRELALYCTKHGIVLSAGHTSASYEQMVEGMQTGILHSTHFFNAMRKLHHRDPGCVGAILIHPEISCELIADGIHVHPSLVKLLLREKPIDKVVLITDALKPTKQNCGCLLANKREVYLTDENIFRHKDDDVIAGSSSTMISGIKNLSKWGIQLEQSLRMASSNPATVLRMDKTGALIPGMLADITVIDDNFNICMTIVAGEILLNRI